MPKRHLQKRAQTVRTLLKSLSANYRNGCPHITEKGVRELVKPAVDALCKASPDIAVAAGLARRFQCTVCHHDPRDLQPWLRDAMTGPLSSLARGIRGDMDAVEGALKLPWSTGPVEGKINKLKLIKRSMYGRANIDLLRCRIIG